MKPLTKAFSNLALTSLVYFSRLGSLPANISPLGSFGFFSGHPSLYLLSILAFDYFVGGIYPGILFTYVGFLAYPALGYLARHQLQRQLLLLPIASFLFFIFSNLGVFYYWYPHTLTGLITCFSLALPFYSRTLISDLIFGYGFLAYKHLLPRLISRLPSFHPQLHPSL